MCEEQGGAVSPAATGLRGPRPLSAARPGSARRDALGRRARRAPALGTVSADPAAGFEAAGATWLPPGWRAHETRANPASLLPVALSRLRVLTTADEAVGSRWRVGPFPFFFYVAWDVDGPDRSFLREPTWTLSDG